MDIVIINEIQLSAMLVQNCNRAVKTRAGARGHHVEDQGFAGVSMEAEHVIIVGFDYAVDHHRQRDCLCVLEVVVRFDLVQPRQRTHVEDTYVRAARRAHAIIMQPHRHFGSYGNTGFDREVVR